MEATKCLKPSDSGSRIGDRASVQAATRVNAEQALYGDLYVKLSVGTTRGEPAHWARSIAPRPCIRLDPCWTRTMKQPFASTARLRGGGPILPTASKPWSCSGHRHLGSSLTASRESAIGRQSYAFAFLDH
jgi:hypothetical protein